MNFSDLSPEFCEKAKNCKSPEELFELAKEEGVEIPDEDLEGVSGGGGWTDCSYVPKAIPGDGREGIDSALVHADFANGLMNGVGFD